MCEISCTDVIIVFFCTLTTWFVRYY